MNDNELAIKAMRTIMQVDELRRERDRYRAALVDIAEYHPRPQTPNKKFATWLQDIAREALSDE